MANNLMLSPLPPGCHYAAIPVVGSEKYAKDILDRILYINELIPEQCELIYPTEGFPCLWTIKIDMGFTVVVP
jgi:hypothetical protein